MVEQSAVAFRDTVEIREESVQVFDDIRFDANKLIKLVAIAGVMGKRMPTTGCPGYVDGSVDPIQGEGNHACRIGLKGQLRQFEKIANLGGKRVFSILAESVGHLRLFRVEPELLVFELRFELSDHGSV